MTESQSSQDTTKQRKEKKMADALRANLKKRKAQKNARQSDRYREEGNGAQNVTTTLAH